ncbi:MAG: hypothetical protein JWR69_2896 [Pedosphaera sp.]|nr:hypothetical protein [Pedosphaera sp.]
MKNLMASAGLLAIGAVGVETAHAQFMAGAEKPWSVAGTLRGFYDDNYNTAPDGPNRRSSFGFEVRPSVSVNLPLEQTSLTLSYIYSLKYFEDRANNKYDQSHDVELALTHNFSERYSLDLADSFVIAQEPELIDRVNSNPIRSNGNNIRNNGAINFHAQLTPLLGVVLGYANTLYDYEQTGVDSLSARLDRFEHLVTLNTRWQIQQETVGIVGYDFTAVDHTSNFALNTTGLPIAPSSRDMYAHSFYVGAEHTFRRDLSGSAKAGVQYVDNYNNPFIGNSVNPYADLSLSYNYSDKGTVTAGFHSAVNQTDETFNPGGITSLGTLVQNQESATLYGSALYKITPKLTGTLTGQFQNSTFVGGFADGKSDQFYLVGLNLAYQFTHYISAEIGYNYDNLKSDLPGRGYDRNRVYAGITASY